MRNFFGKTACFLALISPLFVQSQNLSGIWQGTVRQSSGDSILVFSYTLYVQQTGDQMVGTSWSYEELKPYFSEKKFTASKTGNEVVFQEEEILGESPAPNGPFWGLSYGNFQHDPETDELTGELVFQEQSPVASSGMGRPLPFLRATVKLTR